MKGGWIRVIRVIRGHFFHRLLGSGGETLPSYRTRSPGAAARLLHQHPAGMKSGDAVRALLDVLTAKSIPHMVTGGLVANAHGIVRSTQDADIAVQGEALNFPYIERWCDFHSTRAK